MRTRLVLLLTAFLAACGGGGSTPAPVTIPQAPVPPVTVACSPASWAGTAGLAFLAGDVSGGGTFDAPLPYATFTAPQWLAADRAGNRYVVDAHALRRISGMGEVSTLATSPDLAYTNGLAIRPDGSVYLANSATSVVYRLSGDNTLTVYAGAENVHGTEDGAGPSARFGLLGPLAADGQGNLYLADLQNDTFALRRIAPDGTVSTRWRAPLFGDVRSMVLAADGMLYLATQDRVLRLSPDNVLTPIAGTQWQWQSVDGQGSAARFGMAQGMAFGPDGALYVADGPSLRRVTLDGNVTTWAGAALERATDDGPLAPVDGPRAAARFGYLRGVLAGADGSLLLADPDNHAVRRLAPDGTVSTWAGSGLNRKVADGQGASAGFAAVSGLGLDCSSNVVVADASAHVLRKVAPDGKTTTLGGTAGTAGHRDGPLAQALFNMPQGVAGSPDGTLYVADTGNHVIRKISVAGDVTTFAGKPGTAGLTDGAAGTGLLDAPSKVVFMPDGGLAVIDGVVIRRVEKDGTLRTLAGAPQSYWSKVHADGKGTAALFVGPLGMVADLAGNLNVSEGGYSQRPLFVNSGTIRKITPDGTVTTVAGAPGQAGFADGVGSTARLSDPRGLAFDAAGNLYIADSGNNAIRVLTPAGQVRTVLGGPARAAFLPGALAAAAVERPAELVFTNGALVIGTLNGLVVARGLP